MGKPKQVRLLTQPRGSAAAQLKADFVGQVMTHIVSLTERFKEVNAMAIVSMDNADNFRACANGEINTGLTQPT
jgi:hypothetical protein